jgi:formate dehydrogenase major subunit
MNVSRRGFIKLLGAGTACFGLSRLGLDVAPARAYSLALKTAGTQEFVSICPYCSCGCNIIMSVKDGKFISSEGDPDYPVSEGSLCAKGAAFRALHINEHRIVKPLYRAPGSDKWVEKDWSFMLGAIAKRIKQTRDRDFKQKNDKGQVVNRLDTVFELGSALMDNEECAVTVQALRGLGIYQIDHQARV